MSGKLQNIAHLRLLTHIFRRSLKSWSLNIVKQRFLIRAGQISRSVLIIGATKSFIQSCFYTFKQAKNIEWPDGEILSQMMVIIPCIQEPFAPTGVCYICPTFTGKRRTEFWPNTINDGIPIGGSLLSILTKDYRLYFYHYRSGNPNFWSDKFELSVILRRHVINEFIKSTSDLMNGGSIFTQVEDKWIKKSKVGFIFPLVISSEFRMGQYRDDNHREDAPHFIRPFELSVNP